MRVTLKSAMAVALMTVAAVVGIGQTVAGAQDGDVYVSPPAEVQAATAELSPAQPTTVAQARAASASSLAFTGGDVMALVLASVVTIGCGAALLLVRRRSQAA